MSKKQIYIGNQKAKISNASIKGDFVQINDETFYKISNFDKMAPFLISIVSATDHWMYISSKGGITAGRKNSDNALFAYTNDVLHDVNEITGGKTIIIDVGLVGKVKEINAELIMSLVKDGFIPVIAPTGMGDHGETYNINADIVAGEVAAALKAEKLVLLTDVEGVWDSEKRLINTMDNSRALQMIDDGTIAGGMFPKVKCCLKALRGGVRKAHIIDGRKKHAMLLEVFTDQGVGTEIVL